MGHRAFPPTEDDLVGGPGGGTGVAIVSGSRKYAFSPLGGPADTRRTLPTPSARDPLLRLREDLA